MIYMYLNITYLFSLIYSNYAHGVGVQSRYKICNAKKQGGL